MASAQATVEEMFARVDVTCNGARLHDIQVHDTRFYTRVLAGGSRALGEMYVAQWWDSDDIPELVARLSRIEPSTGIVDLAMYLRYQLLSRFRTLTTTAKHYNLGNTLYESFLGSTMQYSCASFDGVETIDDAQKQKLTFVAAQLAIEADDTVLDVGCGWGGAAHFIAARTHVQVTGVTLSSEQARYATKLCAGLPVTILQEDYTAIQGTYDNIIALEVLEHVGRHQYKSFMQKMHAVLRDSGRMFIQVTTGENRAQRGFDPWLEKYIFPQGRIPKKEELINAMEGLFAYTEITHPGMDYEHTLLEWFKAFDANYSTIAGVYDEQFYRMWKYYLLFCAGTFRAGINTTTQFLLTKQV